MPNKVVIVQAVRTPDRCHRRRPRQPPGRAARHPRDQGSPRLGPDRPRRGRVHLHGLGHAGSALSQPGQDRGRAGGRAADRARHHLPGELRLRRRRDPQPVPAHPARGSLARHRRRGRVHEQRAALPLHRPHQEPDVRRHDPDGRPFRRPHRRARVRRRADGPPHRAPRGQVRRDPGGAGPGGLQQPPHRPRRLGEGGLRQATWCPWKCRRNAAHRSSSPGTRGRAR